LGTREHTQGACYAKKKSFSHDMDKINCHQFLLEGKVTTIFVHTQIFRQKNIDFGVLAIKKRVCLHFDTPSFYISKHYALMSLTIVFISIGTLDHFG
jgi:hypothetical protein